MLIIRTTTATSAFILALLLGIAASSFNSFGIAVHAQQQSDPCVAEDDALDACLTSAGMIEADIEACDACIEGIYNTAGLTTGSTEVCDDANIIACTALAETCDSLCMPCEAEMTAKSECEIDAERASNGSTCIDPITCDSGGGGEEVDGNDGTPTDNNISSDTDNGVDGQENPGSDATTGVPNGDTDSHDSSAAVSSIPLFWNVGTAMVVAIVAAGVSIVW